MTENLPSLKVLIVGGGVSGLMMAILLERAGINYVVIEKQKSFKPSARSVCLSAVILPVLEQLGLLPDIVEIAKPVGAFYVVTHKYESIGELSLRSFEERYGYATMILPRPSFYNILLSRIPKEKIILGRRVLSISQSANGVLVRCSDGTNFSGDILIGADGAKKTKFLPECDLQPMEYDSYKITGLTSQMDALPDIDESNFTIVVGKDRRYTLWMIPMADKRLAWSVDLNLHNKKASKGQEEAFKQSDYGPESMEEICHRFRDHPSHIPGVTLGDIFDASPPHLLQRAVMHQKVYETWHGGRTVLVGDDCVTLANLLHELKSNTLGDIQEMFEVYRSERYPTARKALDISRHMQSIYNSNGVVVSLIRKLTFKRGVDFMYCKMNDISHARRLLVTFLTFPPVRGTFKRIDPSPSTRLMDHLPIFNSYEATKAYLARASEAIHSQQVASEEARLKQQQQQEESRLYHYHHSYRQPFSAASMVSGSGSGGSGGVSGSGISSGGGSGSGSSRSNQDERPASLVEGYEPYYASSSRSSSLSREMSGFGSQLSS
ncbi:hypothetical protein DFQ26_007393 [Actinomortierella ambigua]|nr:hypothetical protein DFQ26_007393 [Actinomortierella ambigua]